MESLKQYKDILGRPGEGFHTHELFGYDVGFAYLDLLATIVLSFVLASYLPYSPTVIFTILMIVGLIAHILFSVRTEAVKKVIGEI